jgi:hypothetical protein
VRLYRVRNRDQLFSALGLLASFYVMTHFPVEDFLLPWLVSDPVLLH